MSPKCFINSAYKLIVQNNHFNRLMLRKFAINSSVQKNIRKLME